MEQLKGAHQGQTVNIVGKGPSLRYLEKKHFGDGPVITLNHAILPVEALGLKNPVYSMQKDWGKCSGDCAANIAKCVKVAPAAATLLVSVHESAMCLPDYSPRLVFNLGDLGMPWNTASLFVAIAMAKYFGCEKYRLISCDAISGGDLRAYEPASGIIDTASEAGYMQQKRVAHEKFLPKIDHEFITPETTAREMPGRRVSIVIPVIRPESAKRCMAAIRENAGVPSDQYEIVTAFDDFKIGCPEMVKRLVAIASHDLVMFLGDDTVPQPGFLKAAIDEMDKLPDGWGVVGLNTESPGGSNPFAHWMAHKKMLDHLEGGTFFSLAYKHAFCDNELKDVACEMGRWAFAGPSLIEHRHPINKSADYDDAYKGAYEGDAWEHDSKTYTVRKRERLRKRDGRRLALAFPLTDIWTYSQFTFSILKVVMNYMIHLFNNNESIHIEILMPNFPGNHDVVRNDLVRQAQVDGFTDILMMDTDQIYQDVDTIERLIAHNLPVVGAKVHRRYPPFDPVMLRGDISNFEAVPDIDITPDNKEFYKKVKVDATGCACILYDMAVFDDIKYPWFELTVGDHGNPIGEDVGFCAKLKERGVDIFVDCSIEVRHLALMAVGWDTHRLHQKIMGVKQNGT